MKIYVKNMACESCVIFVKETLEDLEIPVSKVELGEIETFEDVSDSEKKELDNKIKEAGMELIAKKEGVLIEKIKRVMVDYVNNPEEQPNINFSEFISQELNHSYSYLSNFFSEVEATTIQQYLIKLKIEKVKELIIFGDDTFSEIAYKLNYSSSAHLSSQFKKMTGLTLSHFKALKEKRRVTIQKV